MHTNDTYVMVDLGTLRALHDAATEARAAIWNPVVSGDDGNPNRLRNALDGMGTALAQCERMWALLEVPLRDGAALRRQREARGACC
jgi:CTP:molybdopterin cytidylyltransferase MocA